MVAWVWLVLNICGVLVAFVFLRSALDMTADVFCDSGQAACHSRGVAGIPVSVWALYGVSAALIGVAFAAPTRGAARWMRHVLFVASLVVTFAASAGAITLSGG